MSPIVRRIGILLLVLLAVAVPLGLAPGKPDTSGYKAEVAAAQVLADMNEESASGAPQQQVVNGWHEQDLLETMIAQNNDMLQYQHTTSVLLVVAVLAVGWGILWSGRKPESDAAPEPVAAPVLVDA